MNKSAARLLGAYQRVPVEEYPNSVVNDPKVSVFVQTYNQVDHIAECLDSILRQTTNFEYEILLGDDESDDGTRKICLDYSKKYPNKIRLFLHSRGNNIKVNGRPTGRFVFLYNAFQASGKFMALCEGDDYWTDPCKLQKQVDLIEKNPHCSMCVAKTQFRNIDDYSLTPEYDYKPEFHFIDIFYKQYFHTSSYLIPGSYLNQYLKANKNLKFGDTSMRYILADMGPFVFLDEFVSVYRITGHGIWSSLNKYEQVKMHIQLHESFFKHFNRKYRQEFSKILIGEYFQMLILTLKMLRIRAFIEFLPKYLWHGVKAPNTTIEIIKIYLTSVVNKHKTFFMNGRLD
jgi:glycosyltransferase involved in cell wall biosynthesis